MTDFSTWQQTNLISFCEQSNKRMREQKEEIESLKNREAKLLADLARTKPKRASTLPAPRHGPCNLAAWGILVETDAEFTERAGTQAAEVVE